MTNVQMSTPGSAPMIEVRDLAFGYGRKPLFEHLSFALSRGEILSVLGPNGAGKTTLLKCLMGFLKPSAGEILYEGKPLASLREKDLFRQIAYVPQNRELPRSFTVLDSVLMGLTGEMGIFSVPGRLHVERAERMLERLGLSALSDRPLGELSGGEVQLALLARAFVKEPKILILDEPEAGLDFRNQLLVLETVFRTAKETGMTVILNTHDPAHALRFADRGLLFVPSAEEGLSEALFEPIGELITEKNIKKSFGVEAKVTEIQLDDTALNGVDYSALNGVDYSTLKSVIPIKVSNDKEES